MGIRARLNAIKRIVRAKRVRNALEMTSWQDPRISPEAADRARILLASDWMKGR